MPGNTGPQGPRGAVGAQGPRGITGQNGIQGIRGFPGPVIYPVSVQVLRSGASSQPTTYINGSNVSVRLFEGIDASPNLNNGSSVTIVGFSNDSSTGYMTFPVGQYYIEACSTLSSNYSSIGTRLRLMQSNTEGYTTMLYSSASGTLNGSVFLEGPLIVNSENNNPYYFANITTSSQEGTVGPNYSAIYYGSPSLSGSVPNISVAIMKFV